jgi:hypothetical protein
VPTNTFRARTAAPLLFGVALLGCVDGATAPRAAVRPSTVIVPLTCTFTLGDMPRAACRPTDGSGHAQVRADGTIIVSTNTGPLVRLTIPSVTVTQVAVVTFNVNWSITNVGKQDLGCTLTISCQFNIPDRSIGNRIFIIAGPFAENGRANPGINNKDGMATIGPYSNVPYWQFVGIIKPGATSDPHSRPMSFNLLLPGAIRAFIMQVGLEVVTPGG